MSIVRRSRNGGQRHQDHRQGMPNRCNGMCKQPRARQFPVLIVGGPFNGSTCTTSRAPTFIVIPLAAEDAALHFGADVEFPHPAGATLFHRRTPRRERVRDGQGRYQYRYVGGRIYRRTWSA